ncbi:MBL fold metallo-hydrolase [Natronosalvus rutilus]|uniref:MBL fold metallo-hydrolase n=1 Tax=Natronosalvus rutilus TaxID=2953753 RepID=A0A9E7N8P8_9EURY|nr:MBL fold metallo-hydrolase [Natronosalvus rutilus]UTF53819.1 MBL fold metallo-hydrolase [Natronosalvus rutilus]
MDTDADTNTDTDIGAVREVDADDCADLYFVDTGMYDTSEYGAAYVLDADRPAVVETGIGTNHERILEALDTIGIDRSDLEAIVVTHIHLDHAGGAGFLAEACPNADVYAHHVGAPHLIDPERLVAGTKAAVGDQWEFYVDPNPVPEERVVAFEDGDVIDLGNYSLIAHDAPGHAPHQAIFKVPKMDAVFTGDAAGIWVPSLETIRETSPPAQFDLEGCLDDLETIRKIDPSVLLYTHFGPREVDDLGAALEAYGDVLESWVGRVERTRAELEDDEAVVDALAEGADERFVEVWGERKTRAETAMNARGVLGYLDWTDA